MAVRHDRVMAFGFESPRVGLRMQVPDCGHGRTQGILHSFLEAKACSVPDYTAATGFQLCLWPLIVD